AGNGRRGGGGHGHGGVSAWRRLFPRIRGAAARRATLPAGMPRAAAPRTKALPVVLAAALAAPAAARAASYPPEYRFRTITSEHVAVHFHQGEEAMAREAAALADEILERHEARYRTK